MTAARPTVPSDAELDAMDEWLRMEARCAAVEYPEECGGGGTYTDTADALLALRAERDALREALRKFCIKRTSAVIDPPHGLVLCLLCKTISRELDPRRELGHERDEQHAPGCLAAPEKEPNP